MDGLPLTDPIVETIQPSGLTVGVEDWITIPSSDTSAPLARINLLRESPDGSGRLFVNDLRGTLWMMDGNTISQFADLSVEFPDFQDAPGLGTGFASFAFHPEFAANGKFYTAHSEFFGSDTPDYPVVNGEHTALALQAVLTEWTMDDPSDDSWSGTQREMLRIDFSGAIHAMQEIAFNPTVAPGDPDYGMLYIGIGEGSQVQTAANDGAHRLDSPLGTIFRIDPLGNNSANGEYGIPADNPYATDGDPDTLGEIYAWGFRNPHRISWDAVSGKALVGEIGQGNIEEINLLEPGNDYGWYLREGTFEVDEDDPNTVYDLPADDASFGYTYPVAQYDHDEGFAVLGGHVYRGSAIPSLQGQYVFADIVTGRMFHVPVDDLQQGSQATIHELSLENRNGDAVTLQDLVGDSRADPRFGVDDDGEIYILSKTDGKVRLLFDPAQRDVVTVTPDDDVVNTGDRGRSVDALGGRDFINSGAGGDRLLGGGGDDVIRSAGGNDFASGGNGDDDVDGGEGNDLVTGGIGIDTLSGGEGLDEFLVRLGTQADLIRDFDPNDDIVRFIGYGFADAAAALGTATQDNTDVVFSLGSDTVTLAGVDLGDLSASNVAVSDGPAGAFERSASQQHLVAADGVTLLYNQPPGVYFSGTSTRTYYAYTNTDTEVAVTYYDHDLEAFGPETVIEALDKRPDDHLSPAIHVEPDGTIMVAYAHHSSELKVYRSQSAESLDSFEQVGSFAGYYTYPSFLDDGNGLKLFVRQGIGGTGNPKGMYNFITTEDSGTTWTDFQFGAAFDNPWLTYGFPPVAADGELFLPFYFYRTDEPTQDRRPAYAVSTDGGATWSSSEGVTDRLTPENALLFAPSGNIRIIDAARVDGEWLVSMTRFDAEYGDLGDTALGQIIRVSDGAVLYEREVAVNYYADGMVFDKADPYFLYVSAPEESLYGGGALLMLRMDDSFQSARHTASVFGNDDVHAIRPGTSLNAPDAGALNWIDVQRYDRYFDFETSFYASPEGFKFEDFSDATKGLRIDLEDPGENQGAALGLITDAQHIFGSDFSQTLRGDSADNFIFGGMKRDFILGRDGDDWLDGALGDDVLNGGNGADILRGGPGSDLLIGGAGIDVVDYREADAGVRVDLADDSQNNGRAMGDRTRDVEGIYGPDYRSSLRGDDGNNILVGGGDVDFISGRGGDDEIDGRAGDDYLWGHLGADVFVFDEHAGNDLVFDFGLGPDRLKFVGNIDVEIDAPEAAGTYVRFDGNEVLLKNFTYTGFEFDMREDGFYVDFF